jgi:hypothetical protein
MVITNASCGEGSRGNQCGRTLPSVSPQPRTDTVRARPARGNVEFLNKRSGCRWETRIYCFVAGAETLVGFAPLVFLWCFS